MNPLKSVETMIANLVEGAFGRVFRAEVRPMELARKLAREMDAHRTVSVSRTYVPNEYAVWLSPRDRERYEGVEHEVIDELCAYLLEHARREDLIMASPPHIVFHTDERLSLGEFGIQARTARPDLEDRQEQAPALPRESRPAPQHGNTMIYSASVHAGPGAGAVQAPAPQRPQRALLALGARRLLVPPAGAVVGRSRDCDVVLDDAGVSRRHAHIRPTPDGWTLEDLGSTNGVRVNGHELHGVHALHPGDRLELGSTEVVFEVS
ncbi:MAG TPA: DUF3662 and FHA domain-containing protein [Solirubrobacteraceae bacterium]|nr:DUF3662 and FHA domain-containing protein [Solirubrobacteraceae bacterium]